MIICHVKGVTVVTVRNSQLLCHSVVPPTSVEL